MPGKRRSILKASLIDTDTEKDATRESVETRSGASIDFSSPIRDVRHVVQQTSLNYEGLEPLASFNSLAPTPGPAGIAAAPARPIVTRVPWIAPSTNAGRAVPQTPCPSTGSGPAASMDPARLPLHCVFATDEQGVECIEAPRASEVNNHQLGGSHPRVASSPAQLHKAAGERQPPLPVLSSAGDARPRCDATHLDSNEVLTEPSDIQQNAPPRAARVSAWDDSITVIDQLVKKYQRSIVAVVLLAVGGLMLLVFGHRAPSIDEAPNQLSTTAEETSSRLRPVELVDDMQFAPVESVAARPLAIALGPQGHAQRRSHDASGSDGYDDDITPFGPYSHSVEPRSAARVDREQSDAVVSYPSTNMPAIGIGVSIDGGDTSGSEEDSSNVAILRSARPTR